MTDEDDMVIILKTLDDYVTIEGNDEWLSFVADDTGLLRVNKSQAIQLVSILRAWVENNGGAEDWDWK